MSSTTTSTSSRADQGGGVRADQPGVHGGGPGLLRMGHGDADELEPDARTGGDVVGAREEYLGQRAADVAAAEQCDPDRGSGVRMGRFVFPGRGRVALGVGDVGHSRHGTACPRADPAAGRRPSPQPSSRIRSSNVSRRTTTRALPSETKTTAGRGTLL